MFALPDMERTAGPLRRALGWAAVCAWLANIAFSCASAEPAQRDVTVQPASSAARAQARAERRARAKALAEQEKTDTKAPTSSPPPPPPPPHPVKATASAALDAGPGDAGAGGGEEVGDANAAPPVAQPLCDAVCEKVTTCASRNAKSGNDRALHEMIRRMHDSCVEHCERQRTSSDETAVRACLDVAECDVLLACLGDAFR